MIQKHSTTLLISSVFGLAATFLSAETSDWSGTDSGDWTDGSKWSDGVPGVDPGVNSAQIGAGSAPSSLVEIDVDTAITLHTLGFGNGLHHRLFGEDISLLNGGGVNFIGSNLASDPLMIENNFILLPEDSESDGAHAFVHDMSPHRAFHLTGDISAGQTSGTVTLTFSMLQNNGSYQVTGNLKDHATEGALAVVIETGGRIIRLNGDDNDFSGGVTVNSGRFAPGYDNALGTGTVTWNGGELLAGNVDGISRTFSNDLIWDGNMAINQANVTWEGEVTLGSFDGAAPMLTYNHSAARTQTFAGPIKDGGFDTVLTIDGSGNQFYRFQSANPDWSGGLIFSTGTIVVEDGATLGTGTIEQNSGLIRIESENGLGTGTYVINGGGFAGIGNLNIPNAVEWNGSLFFDNSNSGNQTFTGDVVLGTDANLDVIYTAGTSASLTFAGTISDGGNDKPIILGDTSNIISLNFTGNNTFTGGLVVEDNGNAKTVRVGQTNALGTGPLVLLRDGFNLTQIGSETDITLPNPIELDANINLGSYAGWEFSGPVALSTVDDETVGIDFGGTSNVAVFSGVVSDATNVTFVKSGDGTLAFSNNSNAIDGTIQVDGGGIQVGAGGASGQLGSATIELGSGASLIFNRSDAFTFDNEVNGAGGLIARAGDAELTGTLTFTGNSTVEDGGTLRINTTYDESSTFTVLEGGTFGGTGTIGDTNSPTIELAEGAFLSPGAAPAPGTLTLGPGTTLDLTNIQGEGTGALVFRLGSVSDRVDGGFLLLTDNLLGFTDFNFTTVTGFTNETTYILFDNIATTGSLDDDNLEGMVGGYLSFLELDGSTLSLHVTAIPEPATVAAILGALALAGVMIVRRRRR